MNEPLLHIENLRVAYSSGSKTVHAVNGVSLDIEKGRPLALSGRQGQVRQP